MKGLSSKRRKLISVSLLCAMTAVLCFGCPHNTVTITTTEEVAPAEGASLADDSPAGKNPAFIASLIDSRPLEWNGAVYEINQSAAVIGLDVRIVIPAYASWVVVLLPSYADAIKAANESGKQILPSVNLVNGKAKQFDDGLYAAMDLAHFRGVDASVPSFPDIMRRLYEAVKANPKSAAFFSAGLSIAKIDVAPVDADAKRNFLADFENNEVASKPTGFYTWNDELKTLFRFFRFFQQRIDDRSIADSAAAALLKDEALRKDYEKILAFYSGLTNPFIDLSCADLLDGNKVSEKSLEEIAKAKGLPARPIGPGACVLPYSGTTETVLFEKLFPEGLPANVNLMKELITRIRSGEVDLAPRKDSGWYDRQVYALETLLLPEKGEEAQKLCMTAGYKEHTLEAFKAILTKTRETHARQASSAYGCSSSVERPPEKVTPRLRLEPAPSFYLRIARSYAFVEKLVTASLGKDALHTLNRIRQDGKSDLPLDEELGLMKTLFYGFYLVSCEDIGLEPALAEGEVENADGAMKAAALWLENCQNDPDLACDTRVSVPVYNDLNASKTTLWATLGVRMADLKATYEKPPSIRIKDSEWRRLTTDETGESLYLIPVDEFAEITLPRLGALTREELRAICDREKTKEKILSALQK